MIILWRLYCDEADPGMSIESFFCRTITVSTVNMVMMNFIVFVMVGCLSTACFIGHWFWEVGLQFPSVSAVNVTAAALKALD